MRRYSSSERCGMLFCNNDQRVLCAPGACRCSLEPRVALVCVPLPVILLYEYITLIVCSRGAESAVCRLFWGALVYKRRGLLTHSHTCTQSDPPTQTHGGAGAVEGCANGHTASRVHRAI